MYSPKVREDLIPDLYRLGRARGRPMTHLVSEAVERYLADESASDTNEPGEPAGDDNSRRMAERGWRRS